MKKYIFAVFFIFAAATIGCAMDYDDEYYYDYPFADVCAPEIKQYCDDIDYDVGDCMLEYQDILPTPCADAIFLFDRDRWGWNPHIRDRWEGMSHEERAAYRADHADEMRAHTHESGADGHTGRFNGGGAPHNGTMGGGMSRFHK